MRCILVSSAHWLVEAPARRQKRVDQAQSLNPYAAAPNGRKLDALYRLAWERDLKTTHYLRTQSATHVEWAMAAYSITSSARTRTACEIVITKDDGRRWPPMAEEKYDVIDIAQPIESSRCRGLTVHS
jgi:Ribonucleotide reductase, barrel domain